MVTKKSKYTLEDYFADIKTERWFGPLAKFVYVLLGGKTCRKWTYETLSKHGYADEEIAETIRLFKEHKRRYYAILKVMTRSQRMNYGEVTDTEKEQIAERAQAKVEDINRLIEFFEKWWLPYA